MLSRHQLTVTVSLSLCKNTLNARLVLWAGMDLVCPPNQKLEYNKSYCNTDPCCFLCITHIITEVQTSDPQVTADCSVLQSSSQVAHLLILAAQHNTANWCDGSRTGNLSGTSQERTCCPENSEIT